MSKKTLFLFVLLTILVIGLLGISSITYANAQSTQQEILPDTVVWVAPFNQDNVVVTDPARVQALYDALYSLPHISPPSPYKLAHEGVGPVTPVYILQFFAHHHLLKQVKLQAISLNGLELAPHDYRQYTKHFWSVFAQTFQPHRPSSPIRFLNVIK